MQHKILQERRESFLKDILHEALGSLNDIRLNNLQVTMVQCSKGKHDAKVFIESSGLTKEEQAQILHAFKKAKPIIQEYILNATTWHSAPKLTLEFDKSLQIQNNLDKIFAEINKNNKENT